MRLLFSMKTTGLFNNCVVSKNKVYFCGETKEGISICADENDVKKGFKLFTNYKVHVDDEKTEAVPFYGIHANASIVRTPLFFQAPEWLRNQRLLQLLKKMESKKLVQSAITRLEGICDMKRFMSVIHSYPSNEVK